MSAVLAEGDRGQRGAAASEARLTALAERSNLTRAQLLIWIGQKLSPGVPLYNMSLAITVRGALDRNRFERAFDALVTDCDALRSVVEERDGVPFQKVLSDDDVRARCGLAQLDFTGRTDPAGAARHWMEQRCRRSFDIAQIGIDAALLRLSDRVHVWFLNQHHLFTDAWSSQLLVERLNAHYGALGGHGREIPEGPVSYADWAVWLAERQASERTRSAQSHWRGSAPPTTAPAALYGTGAARTPATAREQLVLGPQRNQGLRALASGVALPAISADLQLHCLFAALTAAFIHRLADGASACIGTPVHNRSHPRFRGTPGLLVELFPLSCEVDGSLGFSALLESTALAMRELLALARPGASSVESNQRFDVVLNFLTMRLPTLAGLPAEVRWLHPGAGDVGHKLRIQACDFRGDGEFELLFDFNQDLFGPSLRGVAVGQYEQLIDAVIADPDRPLDDLDLASAAQRDHRIHEFNRTDRRPPGWAGQPLSTTLDRFLHQADRHPNRTAVRCGSRSTVYADLRRGASALATRLAAAGAGPGQPVAILLERSTESVTAVLAAWSVGAYFVPLDPDHPPARNRAVMQRLIAQCPGRPLVVVTSVRLLPDLPPECRGVLADPRAESGPEQRLDAMQQVFSPTPTSASTAYAIFTSGSTGEPKGVLVSHGSLANYLGWADRTYLEGEPANLALHSSLAVDLTLTSLLLPLVSGGTVLVYPNDPSGSPAVLDAMRDNAANVVKLTPSHLRLVTTAGMRAPAMRVLIVGGEMLDGALARDAMAVGAPDLALYNEYGPTEATVGCMVHRFDPERDFAPVVPVGRPVDNTRIYVLDANGRPSPTAVTGELCVAGDGVADGYLGDATLTAERFGADPFSPGQRMYRTGDLARWEPDGGLRLLGRSDDQIKIRGVRIELGEVNTALSSFPGVASAVTLARSGQDRSVAGSRVRAQKQLAAPRCRVCGLDGRHPQARIDDEGVCAPCQEFEGLRDRALQYFDDQPSALVELADKMKAASSGRYDCIVLLSGGKDSTYMIHRLAELGLRILSFTLDNGFISEQAKANIRRTVAHLGIEHRFARTEHMNAIFVDSLERHANVCNGCFKTIYTLVLDLAREVEVGYVVTGLSRGQIFETRLQDSLRRRDLDPTAIDRDILAAREIYHAVPDAVTRCLGNPLSADPELLERVQFVDFYRHCGVGLDEVYAYLGDRAPWVRPDDTGRSTNCRINDVGIFVHRRARGYHNYALPYSWDVRLGHKQRDAALAELDDEIDEDYVRSVLADIGYGPPPEAKPPAVQGVELVAYVVAESGPSEDRRSAAALRDALRTHLKARVPAEAVPSQFVVLDELPIGAGGKLDIDRLPDPSATRVRDHSTAGAGAAVFASASAPPETDLEVDLAQMWSAVLDRPEAVGRDDDFFALGGASLEAIELLARIEQTYGVSLPAPVLFADSTLRGIAEHVEAALVDQITGLSDAEVLAALEGGSG